MRIMSASVKMVVLLLQRQSRHIRHASSMLISRCIPRRSVRLAVFATFAVYTALFLIFQSFTVNKSTTSSPAAGVLVFIDDTNHHPQNDRHTSTNYTSKHWVKDANVKSDTRHQQASVSMSKRAHNRFVSLLPPRDGKEHDRITKQLEFNITTSSVKLILLAGSHSIASARTRLKSENCNVASCVFTRDYSRLYEADAVLVTGMTLPLSVRPKRRRRRQVSHDRPDRRRLT